MTITLYSTPDAFNKLIKTITELETININELNIVNSSLNIELIIEYDRTLTANLFLINSKWYYLEKYEIIATNTYKLYLKYDVLMNNKDAILDATLYITNGFVASSFASNANYDYDIRKTGVKTLTFPNKFNSELTNIMVLLRSY
jgi:hypothetical protein